MRANFTNSSFSNMRAYGGDGGISMFANYRSAQVRIISCNYSNITSTVGNSGGIIYTYASIVVEFTNFVNISVWGNGGAVEDGLSSSHTFSSCLFQNCSSTQGYGGAIYLESSVPFLINCRFRSNSAANGGNDVYHNSDSMFSSYTASTLSGTCSDSNSIRFLFPNGNNVDNFLIVIKFY
jgi:hypothetical protein